MKTKTPKTKKTNASRTAARVGSSAIVRRLERAGYDLKRGAPGWWVDGLCGYLVAGYGKRADVISEAVTKIKDAQDRDIYPAWRTMTRFA